MRHFHRSDHTLVIDGELYYGVVECPRLFVSPRGVFANDRHPLGGYKGSVSSNGYLHIGVSKKLGTHITAHHIVYEVCGGKEIVGEIDHINCDKKDNRLSNLRVVSCRKENMANPITRSKVVQNARLQLRKLNSDHDHQVMASRFAKESRRLKR